MGGKHQAPATPELVERLKAYRSRSEWGDEIEHPITEEAADALEAQQARIAELEAERDEARDIVAWCNNSLFGSHSYFTAASGKTASEAIEGLKADSREQWRRAESAQALADRYEKALREILEPLAAMKQRAEASGRQLSGLAPGIAYSVSHLQDIARQALSSQGRHEGGEG